MAQLLFDAISATHRLKAAGFAAKQAEAVVRTVTQANSLTLQLVQDLADLKAHVTQNMVTKAFLTETLNQYDLKNMVVKDDIKNMVVKDDLKGFATKDDLKHFATKDDIRNMVVKDDIKNFATKDDLRVLESKLNMKIYLMAGTVVAALKALEYLGI
ncbi:MAG: hypothetical protein OXE51_05745 [Gammaproteobacteria bacterium]|nr:hypothetical protein [Gammaproteobacteria bacterium]